MNHLKNFKMFENSQTDQNIPLLFLDQDEKLENDPLYKKYEKALIINLVLDSMSEEYGIERSEIPDQIMDLAFDYATKKFKGGSKLDPEQRVIKAKNTKESIISRMDQIIDMANKDEEYELSHEIEIYKDLLRKL